MLSIIEHYLLRPISVHPQVDNKYYVFKPYRGRNINYIIPLNSVTTFKIIKNCYFHKREQYLWIDLQQQFTHIFLNILSTFIFQHF